MGTEPFNWLSHFDRPMNELRGKSTQMRHFRPKKESPKLLSYFHATACDLTSATSIFHILSGFKHLIKNC